MCKVWLEEKNLMSKIEKNTKYCVLWKEAKHVWKKNDEKSSWEPIQRNGQPAHPPDSDFFNLLHQGQCFHLYTTNVSSKSTTLYHFVLLFFRPGNVTDNILCDKKPSESSMIICLEDGHKNESICIQTQSSDRSSVMVRSLWFFVYHMANRNLLPFFQNCWNSWRPKSINWCIQYVAFMYLFSAEKYSPRSY